jgi:hypothetical protein
MKITISWKAKDDKGKLRKQVKEYNIRGVETEDEAVEWAMLQSERLGIDDPDIEVEVPK